jgi:hypothetical protein
MITMLVRISAEAYGEAAQLVQSGDPKANPLVVALAHTGSYKIQSYTNQHITLQDVATRRRYTGDVPPVLAEFLAGFQRGVRVMEDYAFDLALRFDD